MSPANHQSDWNPKSFHRPEFARIRIFVQGGDRVRGIQKHLEGMYLVNSAIHQPRLQTSDVLSWTQVFHCQHGHMTHTGQ